MGDQIQKTSMARLLRLLDILLVLHLWVGICTCSIIFNKFNRVDNTRMTTSHSQTRTKSELECCSECNSLSWCRSLSYKPLTNECQLSTSSCKDVGHASESDSEWVTFVKGTVGVNLLVGGPNGVQDSQLTASSFWCDGRPQCATGPDGFSAKYSRLNFTGYYASWIPYEATSDQYIQVEFNFIETIAGVAIQGRPTSPEYPHIRHYVTAFKVLTSLDCVSFSYITDDSDNEKIFEGNSSHNDIVIRYFQELVLAKCVRINPVQWFGFVAVRFDVLGC